MKTRKRLHSDDYVGMVCQASRDRIMALVKEKGELEEKIQSMENDLFELCSMLPQDIDLDNPDAADFKDNSGSFIEAMRFARNLNGEE